jgi:hypothetical protein
VLRPVVTVLALATASALFFTGVAGWRGGPALVLLALPILSITPAGLWVPKGSPTRALWLIAAAVVGIVLGGAMIDRAPLSASRLRQQLDRAQPQFFVTISETTRGHGWCRPQCPEVRRIYRAPNTSELAVATAAAAALRSAHLAGPSLSVTKPPAKVGLETERFRLRSELHRVPAVTGDSPYRLEVVITSR